MANRIKEFRNRLKLSQEKLARAVGTTNQHIGYLERGERSLTQKWLNRLAPVLQCTPAELLGERSVTAEEKELLDNLDSIPPKQRLMLIEMVRSMAEGTRQTPLLCPDNADGSDKKNKTVF